MIVTRNGHPYAVISKIDGDEVEDFVLAKHFDLEKQFKDLSKKHKRLAYKNFDETLSNLGKAASDFILMPSRYEPCGLPQMEAPRFATLPVVRSTGGLKDTVDQLDIQNIVVADRWFRCIIAHCTVTAFEGKGHGA